jgi:hypothetical protein
MSECKQDDSCRQHRSAYEQAGSGFILNVSNCFPEGLVHHHSPLQVLDQAEELLIKFQLLFFIKFTVFLCDAIVSHTGIPVNEM